LTIALPERGRLVKVQATVTLVVWRVRIEACR